MSNWKKNVITKRRLYDDDLCLDVDFNQLLVKTSNCCWIYRITCELNIPKKSQIWPPKNKISPHLLTITISSHSYLIYEINEVLVKWIVQKSNYHAHETVYIYVLVILHAPHSDFNSRFTSIYPQSVKKEEIIIWNQYFCFCSFIQVQLSRSSHDDVDFEHFSSEKEGDKEEWKYEMMWRDVK